MGGTIIHDIYQTAHLMFGDMPQGDHKKRQVQIRLQNPDEAVAKGAVGPGGGAYREEDDHLGPLRHPGSVHLGTKVIPNPNPGLVPLETKVIPSLKLFLD